MKKITITLLLSFAVFVFAHAQAPLPILTGVSGVTGPTGTTGATYILQEDGTGDIGIGLPIPPPYPTGYTGPTSIGVVLGVSNTTNTSSDNSIILAAGNVTGTPGNALTTGNTPFTLAGARLDPTDFSAGQLDFSVDWNGLCGIGFPAMYFNPYFLTSGYSGTMLGVIDPNNSSITPLLTVATNINNPTGYNLAALTVDYRGYTSLGCYFYENLFMNPAHLYLTDPNPSGTDPLLDVVTNANAQSLYIASNGQVIIGSVSSTPSGYNLFVQNGILTEKAKVAVSGTSDWSDYVFDKDYKLPALSEVESYIKANKHLPDVPSADDVVCDGVDLGSMDATLLKKIEELTLYVLELKKDNESMKAEISNLKK